MSGEEYGAPPRPSILEGMFFVSSRPDQEARIRAIARRSPTLTAEDIAKMIEYECLPDEVRRILNLPESLTP